MRGIDGVDRNHAVGLIGKHTRCVVTVNNSRTGEDAFILGPREDGDFLVRPGEKVVARCVAPMLFTSYVGRGVICFCQPLRYDHVS